MIISDAYKFVFIKPMKVAGSSIEKAVRVAIRQSGVRRDGAAYVERRNKIRNQRHASADKIMQHFGPEVAAYTFVSVVRNPWDRAVSLFYWRNPEARSLPHDAARAAFLDWVTSGGLVFDERGSIFTSLGSIYWRSHPIVDVVVKYEHLVAGLAQLGTIVGLPEPIDILSQDKKSDTRSEASRAFEEMYDDAAWRSVELAAARDIHLFGYDRSRPDGGPDPVVRFDAAPIRARMLDLPRRQMLDAG